MTIDIECSMGGAWSKASLEPLDIDTCIWCKRPDGTEHGIRAIMDILEQHRLVGVFFLDSAVYHLFGGARFTEVCQEIDARGHDVQLHLHPGARSYARLRQDGPISRRSMGRSDMLSTYTQDEQFDLIREGCDVLERAVGRRPVAFRAGGYAVNEDTFVALARAAIPTDFSCNLAFSPAGSWPPQRINRPYRVGNVTEFPVTQLIGNRLPWSGHRPFEVNALTAGELCSALLQIHAGQQRAASIVFHSFSMLKGRTGRWENARPNRTVRRRFEALASFLADHGDQFEVGRISDLAADDGWLDAVVSGPQVWPRTTWLSLVGRYLGQLGIDI